MTKQEFIEDCVPFDEWKTKHDNNIKRCFDEMSEYWDIEGFLMKYAGIKASREVLETILYDAFEANNYEDYERDDYISRMLCIPLKEIMAFEKYDGK